MIGNFDTANDRPDTENLLALVAQGNRDAENQLLDRHRERLKRMVDARLDARLVKRGDPSDVVQEALVEASRTLATYVTHRPVAFYPWLRQIAMNKLIDIHRTHLLTLKRSVQREAEFAADNTDSGSLARWLTGLVSQAQSPVDALIQQEVSQTVFRALESLDDDDREILMLRHVEQLSVAEVAEILGIAVGAVKSRHFRAIQQLRRWLDNDV